VRAFRGTRRSSVYREHAVSAAAFVRIAATAARLGLGVPTPGELRKEEARRLADDLGSVRASLELPELDGDLTALAEVARWCSRAGGDAWLTIEESA
jgi:hypothetical protein